MAKVVHLAPAESTVYSVLADTLNQADDFESCIVVTMGKDGDIYMGHSEGSYLTKIGYLEFAKECLMDVIKD